jgi:hypothetical protein
VTSRVEILVIFVIVRLYFLLGDTKVNDLFNMCLLKGGRLLATLAIPKICVSSLFTPVMKINILCSGEHVKSK